MCSDVWDLSIVQEDYHLEWFAPTFPGISSLKQPVPRIGFLVSELIQEEGVELIVEGLILLGFYS